MRLHQALTLVGLVLSFTLAGCGGGSSSGSSTTLTSGSRTGIQITWGARTRGVTGPGSALSAVIDFQNGSSSGDVAWEVDRASAPGSYTQSYTSSTPVVPGVHLLTVTFMANAGGTGGVVATASASVLVTGSGVVENPSGSAFGNVNAVGNLAQVSIVPGQSGIIGLPQSIAVSGIDNSGNQVALTPGAATLQVISGPGTVNSAGFLIGSSAGTVTLVAVVDGISSPQMLVTIASAASNVRSLAQANNNIVLNPVTGTLWATAPSTAGTNANSVVEIDPATGTVLGSVFAGSEPYALAISGDGSTLFVGLNGSSNICSIATSGRTVTQTFSAGTGSFGAAQYVSDIAVQPGSTSVIAVTRADISDSGNSGPEIISNGSILPDSMSTYEGQSLAFASPTQLYTLDNTDSSFAIFNCAVSGTGVTSTSNSWNVFNGFGTTIKYANGRIYGSDGTVLNASTGVLIARFAVTSGLSCTVDTANNLVFFLEGSPGFSSSFAIQAFSLNTFTPVAMVQLPTTINGSSFSDLVRFGATGLAFRSPSTVYFLDQAPGLGG